MIEASVYRRNVPFEGGDRIADDRYALFHVVIPFEQGILPMNYTAFFLRERKVMRISCILVQSSQPRCEHEVQIELCNFIQA